MIPSITKYNLEQILCFHCAPALAGIKCSNLVSLSNEAFPQLDQLIHRYNQLFNPKDIYLQKLCHCKESSLILIFGQSQLTKTIFSTKEQQMLWEIGYPKSDKLDDYLNHLSFRLSQDSFPHEIGIFLGYPLEDVIQFQENQGTNYLCCGYWKVYGNKEKCLSLFKRYTRCRNNVYKRLTSGMSIAEIFRVA